MKRGLSALASAALVGGSLFLGAGAASAITCPAGYHAITMGGVSDCVPNASGGGNGGDINWSEGGGGTGPIGQVEIPGQVSDPVYQEAPRPVYNAPRAPAYTAPRAPAPAAPRPYTPAGGGYAPAQQAPAGNWAAPAGGYANAAPGQQVASAAQQLGAPAAAGSEVPVSAPAAVKAKAKAARAAAVLPTTELQAVKVLQTAKATKAQKDAALAIVKKKIDAVLDKALDKALDGE